MDYYLSQCHYFIQKLYRSSKVFFAIELVLSSVIGILIVFPLLAVSLGLNELLRVGVRLILWLVYKGEVVLSDDHVGSNYFLIDKERRDRHTILYMGELEGPLEVKTVRDNFQKYVIENAVYEKLTWMWEQRLFYVCLRKCRDFDIKNHIRAYPGTENRIVYEEELLHKILPDLGLDMEDLSKPRWEIVIIPNYQKEPTGETKSLKIIRIHHSYMDGASTLIMIANTFSGEAEFPYVIDPCKPLNISKTSMFLYKLTSLALFSSSMVQNLLMPPFLRKSRFGAKSPGKNMYSLTGKIPIKKFQNIKDNSGVSMPAIVSTIVSSAIRNLELEYPKGEKTLETQPLWLVAAMFPYDSDKPGNNHLALETIMDTSDISGCERLALMNDELGRLAKNPLVNVYFWETKMIGRSPTFVAKLFMDLAICPVILSNIPLCTRNIKMWGKECTGVVGWVPLLGRTGLGIVSVRYADHFRYCVRADSSVVSQAELDFFVAELEQQVDELCRETSLLKRKISTDKSLFAREKNVAQIDNSTNNNSYKRISEINYASENFSFISKIKDSIEQIRRGVRKIKEQ